MFSLSDLDAKTKSETPIELEYVTREGVETGIVFSILGSESETVQAAINKMVNSRRKQQAATEATAAGVRGAVAVTPIEDDIAFGHRLTAARLAGWKGIKEEFTAENALKLVSMNADISAFILEVSNQSGRFLQLKPKA
jgi:hypothetical protein